MVQLRVDGNTSVQDLQRFAQQVGDSSKIRGKVVGGVLTLYVSKKIDTGFKEHFFGHVTERRDNARAALNSILGNLRNDPNLNQNAKALLENVATPGGEIRGTALKQFALSLGNIRKEGVDSERKLSEALQLGDQPTIDTCRQDMVQHLSRQLRDGPREDQMRFAGSDGSDYKNTLSSSIHQRVGGGAFAPTYEQCSEPAKRFLDQLYDEVAMQLPDRKLSDTQVLVDGVTYTKEKQLGEGANGVVDLYKGDNNEFLVIKRPQIGMTYQTEKDAFKDNASEVQSHLDAMRAGGDKVIEMKGAFRTPEGGLLMALKLAPGGNSYEVMEGIKKGIQDGYISQDVGDLMNRTMLKDMLQSLHGFQGIGMNHMDLKPPNFFIDEGGVTKMGDFGTAKTGVQVQQEKRLVDNPRWLAPEVLNGHESVSVKQKIMQNSLTPLTTVREQLKGTMAKKDLDTLIAKMQKEREDRALRFQQGTAKVSQESDTWALGVTAHQMFYGKDPLGMNDIKFVFQTEKMLEKFQHTGGRVFVPNEGEQLDDRQQLINGLMHPEPSQRLSPQQALETSVFDDNRIGSNGVRDFLMDPLLRKDPQELTDGERQQLMQKSNQIGGG